MFGQILYTQLKWTRLAVALLSVTTFALPALLWRIASGRHGSDIAAVDLLSGFASLGPGLTLAAIFCGFMGVAQPWAVDAAARHVYPLALPISWRRYVAMRFGAGAILLAIPSLALWLGCLTVLALIDLPGALQAYPTTLAVRFLLGALVAYAIVFAVQYLSGRNAAHLLLVATLLFAGTVTALDIAGKASVLESATAWLFRWPGPLAVFAADWTLIDV